MKGHRPAVVRLGPQRPADVPHLPQALHARPAAHTHVMHAHSKSSLCVLCSQIARQQQQLLQQQHKINLLQQQIQVRPVVSVCQSECMFVWVCLLVVCHNSPQMQFCDCNCCRSAPSSVLGAWINNNFYSSWSTHSDVHNLCNHLKLDCALWWITADVLASIKLCILSQYIPVNHSQSYINDTLDQTNSSQWEEGGLYNSSFMNSHL